MSPEIHPGEERKEMIPLTLGQQWEEGAKKDPCPKTQGSGGEAIFLNETL